MLDVDRRDARTITNGASIMNRLVPDRGAKLHIMRLDPNCARSGKRSAPVQLVGTDYASRTIWIAGDPWMTRQSGLWMSRVRPIRGNESEHAESQEHGNCRSSSRATSR
jgi:hypothetical protein